MADFQYNSFPINATPLADVAENSSADGVLVVIDGVVQKIPTASFPHAVGALDSTDLQPYVLKSQTVNGTALSGNVTVNANAVPFTPTDDIESENVQAAITEAVGKIKVEREVLLYQGSTTAIAADDYALLDDVDNYEYVELWCGYSGRIGVERIPVRYDSSDNPIPYTIRIPNISNDSSKLLAVAELGVHFANNVMTVEHTAKWQQGNSSTYDPQWSGSPFIYIEKVLGIKYDFLAGSGGGGSASWGTISGTLSNQTDLANALADKISAPSSPTSGQFLSWNGSAWVAASLPVYTGGVS